MTEVTLPTSSPGPVTAAHVETSPTDEPLLARVLSVYTPSCRYLKTATISEGGDGLTVARCEFGIPAPFYIEDTGHFNAVEFNLCYNQMMYYAVAKSVKESIMPPFAHWTLDEYWSRQLADFLIVDFHSTFRAGVTARRFYGEIAFRQVRQIGQVPAGSAGRGRAPVIIASTTCKYWDDEGGNCTGEVRLVITNAPDSRAGTADGR